MDHDNPRKAKMWHYAVVQFLTDYTYSEIPTTWLKENNSQCWWPPRTSNCPQMIANCESPDFKTWNCYEVEVAKFCTSLESARKHAADANYQTTDEERLGKGQRQHVPYNRFSSDGEECPKSKPRKYIKKKQFNIVTSKPPSCPENFGLYKKESNCEHKEVATLYQEKRLNTGVSKLPSRPESFKSFNEETNDGRNETSQQGHGNVNTSTVVSNNKSPTLYSEDEHNENPTSQQEEENVFSGSSEERWEDIPILDYSRLPLYAEQALQQNKKENFNIERSLQQLLRMQAVSNFTMKDIKQRLIRLESAIKSRVLNPLDSDDSLIVQLLPLATIDNIKEFESVLKTSNEAMMQFKRFLLKIGGNNPRDNIHRTLKKIFTNGCAINCSWKGIRNNFRLHDLHLMRFMRGEITSHHTTLTESEFDYIAAEWFRFAKQRKTREEKEKNKENEN